MLQWLKMALPYTSFGFLEFFFVLSSPSVSGDILTWFSCVCGRPLIPSSIVNVHIVIALIIVALFVQLTKYLLSQTEVNFLGQLRHSNLVKLIGYCCEDDHRLLVYEYMYRGSLEHHLFRSMLASPLSFCLRLHLTFSLATFSFLFFLLFMQN